MKYRLFLINLLMSGCVTTVTTGKGKIWDNANGVASSEKNFSKFKAPDDYKSESKENSLARTLKYKDYFCNNEKQVKKIEHEIVFLVPKVEKGIPSDLAAEIRNEYVNKSNNYIEKFYAITTSLEENDLLRHRGHLPLKRYSDYLEKGKDFECYDYGRKIDSCLNDWSFFIIDINPNKIISNENFLLSKNDYQHDIGRPSFFYNLYDNKVYLLPYKLYWSFRMPDYIHPTETMKLAIGYTMLIPLDVQKELDLSIDYDQGKSYIGYLSDPTGKKISITEALNWRFKLWHTYLLKFTKITKFASEDPNLFKYKASLDLNLFCKYGRHVDNLLSK